MNPSTCEALLRRTQTTKSAAENLPGNDVEQGWSPAPSGTDVCLEWRDKEHMLECIRKILGHSTRRKMKLTASRSRKRHSRQRIGVQSMHRRGQTIGHLVEKQVGVFDLWQGKMVNLVRLDVLPGDSDMGEIDPESVENRDFQIMVRKLTAVGIGNKSRG